MLEREVGEAEFASQLELSHSGIACSEASTTSYRTKLYSILKNEPAVSEKRSREILTQVKSLEPGTQLTFLASSPNLQN